MVGALYVSNMARTTGIWDGVDKVLPWTHHMTSLGASLNLVSGSPSGCPKILIPGPAPEIKTHQIPGRTGRPH